MSKLIKGFSYSFNRNIGWQDRTIRTILGLAAIIGAFYFFNNNKFYTILLSVFAIAQLGTVFSARCIICFFTGQCTISNSEKKQLQSKGIPFEKKSS